MEWLNDKAEMINKPLSTDCAEETEERIHKRFEFLIFNNGSDQMDRGKQFILSYFPLIINLYILDFHNAMFIFAHILKLQLALTASLSTFYQTLILFLMKFLNESL